MSDHQATRRVKQLAREIGFPLTRITSADILQIPRQRFMEWLRDGRGAEMGWMDEERATRSSDPAAVLDGAQSVICVGLPYWAGQRDPAGPRGGAVARYAWGRDYHAVIGEQLRLLCERLGDELGGTHRWYVDTGPVMDKALAERAGIGWYGRNSNILTEEFGSFVLLGEIVTTLELRSDSPVKNGCGSCRLCVMACPTGAIGPDYSVDSRKCISYLTIEHRGSIPRDLRPQMGAWVFGCDICQDVCPPTMERHLDGEERQAWASGLRALVKSQSLVASAAVPTDPPPSPLFPHGARRSVDLFWLLRLTHAEYLEAFRGSSIKRAKVWMLRRNAAVALGNVGDMEPLGPLADALHHDPEPIVREHAAWALGRLFQRHRDPAVIPPLEHALACENDASVVQEVRHALAIARAETRQDASRPTGA